MRYFSLPRFLLFALFASAVAVAFVVATLAFFPALAALPGDPFSTSFTYLASLTAAWEAALAFYVLRRSDRGELRRELQPPPGIVKTPFPLAVDLLAMISLGIGWELVFPPVLDLVSPGAGRAASESIGRITWDSRPLAVALEIVAIVIVAPFAEELIFRRSLPRVLARRFPPWAAVLIPSAVFGLLHGWARAPEMAVIGLFLSLVYLRRRSLFFVVAIHVANNALALPLDRLLGRLQQPYWAGFLFFALGGSLVATRIRRMWRFLPRLRPFPLPLKRADPEGGALPERAAGP